MASQLPTFAYKIILVPKYGRFVTDWMNYQTASTDGGPAWEYHSAVTVDGDVYLVFVRDATPNAAADTHGYYSHQEQQPQAWEAQSRGTDGKFGSKAT